MHAASASRPHTVSPSRVLAAPLRAWARLRQRLRAWWLQRLPARAHSATQHSNLYLWPTGAGALLALTLLLLLLGSINYQLNLGYLLTFLIAGSASAALWLGQRNLHGLELHLHPVEPVFAGSSAVLELALHNPSRRARYGVGLRWFQADPAAPGGDCYADLPALGQEVLHMAWPAPRRGRWPLPALQLHSAFPLGVVRVWHVWRPAAQLTVYPAPETPAPPLPLGQADDAGAPQSPRSFSGAQQDADGVRSYRRGDPLKWVLWKKTARQATNEHAPWVSRDFGQPQTSEIWLDAARCGLADTEAQRARLCAWVLQADALGLRYGLRLPGLELAPASGLPQRQRCLEALAWH